jgi:hypothetical protein
VPRQRRLPDADYQQFAETFIDAVLDPRRRWLVAYLMTFGFPSIPSEQDIASGQFAIIMHEAINTDWFVPFWFDEALRERDREKLVPWAKQEAKHRELTNAEMGQLLRSMNSEILRQSLKGMRSMFRFRRGPKPHITQDQLATLQETAEMIRSAILKLLAELATTSHTIPEILKYLQTDYADACKFLMRHESKLEAALKDPKLLKRAHRPAARARVIANAMAGCDYDLAFSTSLERAREARRRTK